VTMMDRVDHHGILHVKFTRRTSGTLHVSQQKAAMVKSSAWAIMLSVPVDTLNVDSKEYRDEVILCFSICSVSLMCSGGRGNPSLGASTTILFRRLKCQTSQLLPIYSLDVLLSSIDAVG